LTEAQFYTKEENTVRCLLCPHNCRITPGKKGFCGVRKNINGTLYALTAGRIISAACDPVEKKPLYHFYPGSLAYSLGGFGCNLACRHCQNHEISQQRDDSALLQLYHMTPEEIVQNAKKNRCEMIAWTYNEPTIWYEYIAETSRLARDNGVRTVLITNGVINREPLEALLPYVDAYRVDIKGFSNELYKKLTGFPFLKTVLESAETAYKKGCHVELVSNIIPNWNDSEKEINGIINWIKANLDESVPWHVTAYHPAYKLNEERTSLELLEKIFDRGRCAGLKHIYLGNVYSEKGSDTICPSCGKILIKRIGMNMDQNFLKGGSCPDCGFQLKCFQSRFPSKKPD